MSRFPNAAAAADWAERERARGAREIPSPPPAADLHARVVAAIREPAALPEFQHRPAAEAAPAIPPPTATERAEARARFAEDSVESRMTRAQLADRIQQMEATTRAKATASNALGTRPEKPGATIARADKLKRYKEELVRRDEAARRSDEAAMKENARIDALTQRDTTAQAAAAEAAPALVVCGTCGLLIGQDENGDMQSHLNRQMIECPAPPTNWRRHRTNPRFADQIAKPTAAAEQDARDLDDAQRQQTAQAEAATVAEIPPPPPAAATRTATARRIAVVATARAETLSALDAAVEALVREHTSGAVIEAAWAAAARIFRPGGKRV